MAPANKKKSILMIGLWSLLVSTLSFSALTFAWLNYQKPFSSTNVVSGDLAFRNLATTVYRYDYPTFSGSSIVDYTGTGTVSATTLTTDAHTMAMNKFDPTFITLAHSGTVTQAYIGEIYTNLVLKMSFDLVYSTPVDWSVSLVKNTGYAAYVDTDGVQHYGISNYLNFVGLTSAVFDSLTTDKTLENEIVYYKVKNYALQASSSSFSDTVSALSFFASSITERPSAEATYSATLYFNIDYDAVLSAPFFQADTIGKDYALDMDYSFVYKASQRS
jgi:hypothetical protein